MKRLGTLFSNQKVATTVWVLIDILLINIAFILAYWIRYELQLFKAVDPAYDVPYYVYLPFVALFTLLLILAFRRHGVYRLRHKISWFDEFYAIITGTATAVVIMIVFIFVYRPAFYSRAIFIYAGLLAIAILGVSRLLKVALYRRLRRQGIGTKQVLIIGAGEVARTVMRTMVANRDWGFEIVGFLDDHPTKGETDIGRFKALGGVDNLAIVLQDEAIDEVIITLPWQYHRKIMSIMNHCERENVRVRIVPDLFQITLSQMQVDEFAGIPMIGVKDVGIGGFSLLLKRGIDVVLSAIALVLASPLMGLIALIIKMDSPGPVIFAQERVGKMGRPFMVYKFRSMVQDAEDQKRTLEAFNEADGPLFKIKDDPRTTRLGRQLRRFSLDELPQCYNVLRGEMSLIGPRPGLPSEVAKYQEWQKRRLEVSPGITGLWQISGRSDLTFDEMTLLDIYYIENWSPALDAKILLQTIPRVLFGSGAY